MNSLMKYQLIIFFVLLFKTYSSEKDICPIDCTINCECYKNFNGSLICGNCKSHDLELSDRDSDNNYPHQSTLLTSVRPTVNTVTKPPIYLGNRTVISSDNYPNAYPGNIEMTWIINSPSKDNYIYVDIEEFDLATENDTLTISDENKIIRVDKKGTHKLKYKIRIFFAAHSRNLKECKGFNASLSTKSIKKTTFKTVDKLLIVMACVCIFLFIVFLAVAIMVIIKFRQNRQARRRFERDMNQMNNSVNNADEEANSPSISVISPPSYDVICAQPPAFLDYIPEEKPLPGSSPPAYASFRSSGPSPAQGLPRQPKDTNDPQPSTEA